MTKISWADKTWNPYNWYCTKISAGCKNCYMFAMRKKFNRQPDHLQWRDTAMKEYRAFKPGEVIFVNSMSDTYHEDAPIEWIQEIHHLIASKPEVQFLILTKRPQRVAELWQPWGLVWPDNLWLGVSIESKEYLWRIDTLHTVPAAGLFISAEPLLESLTPEIGSYNLEPIDWLIVGAESGPNRRPFDKQWARQLLRMCDLTDTHFTFKQGSAHTQGKDTRLDGTTYLSTPFSGTHDIRERKRSAR